MNGSQLGIKSSSVIQYLKHFWSEAFTGLQLDLSSSVIETFFNLKRILVFRRNTVTESSGTGVLWQGSLWWRIQAPHRTHPYSQLVSIEWEHKFSGSSLGLRRSKGKERGFRLCHQMEAQQQTASHCKAHTMQSWFIWFLILPKEHVVLFPEAAIWRESGLLKCSNVDAEPVEFAVDDGCFSVFLVQ